MKAFFGTRAGVGLLHAAFALAVSLILLAPMLFTGRTFGQDWTNHLYAMYVQGESISSGGPSLFMHTDGVAGVFYPHYAFYGGSLYAIGGALAVVLGGNAVLAYLLTWVAAFLTVYAGMLWLSFQVGLRGWEAHAAPLVVVTSTYYIGTAYAKGSWPELVALSVIPLLLAAGLSLLRSPRITLGPSVAFVVAAVLFTGSHNLTLVWGTVAIAALVLVVLLALPASRRVPRDRVLSVLLLGGLAMAVNAWFLLPDVVYADRTFLGHQSGHSNYWQVSDWYNNPVNVFSPILRSPPELASSRYDDYPTLNVQLPVLVLLWAIVVGFVLRFRRGPRPQLSRLAGGLAIVLVGFIALLLFIWPVAHLPRPLNTIQFTFRLESYIVIVLGLLVAVLLSVIQLWKKRDARLTWALRGVLAAALTFGFGQAVFQAWQSDSYPVGVANHPSRGEAADNIHKLPPYWATVADYGDVASPLVMVGPRVRLDPNQVKDDRLRASVPVPPASGALMTNVAAGPYLVRISGARHVGRNLEGYQVVVPTAGQAGPRAEIHVAAEASRAVVAGRWISFLAVLGLVAAFLLIGYRELERRRNPR